MSLGPAFRHLLVAATVTNLGDGIRLAALPLLAITLTDSPVLITGVTAAQFLPWLLFGPVAGVIVDRANRRRLILITQTWRAAVMIGLGLAVLTDTVTIWALFVVAFVITAGEILVDPSVVALVPTLVSGDDLDRANGRISTTEIVTNDLVGSPVGTGLFAAAPWLPFVADGASYLGSVVPFSRLPPTPRRDRPDRPDPAGGGAGLRAVLAEVPKGLRWLVGHPLLAPWTLFVTVFNMGSAAAFSLLVLLVDDVHAGSPLAYGLTLTLAALGGAVGAHLAPDLVDGYGRRPVLGLAATVGALILLGLAAAPNLVAVMALWGLGGISSGILLAIGRGFIQRYAPNEILGRAAIASRTITRTAFVVGALMGGLVAQGLSTPTAYVVAGAIQVVALAPLVVALGRERSHPG